jgi:hypothetical protein
MKKEKKLLMQLNFYQKAQKKFYLIKFLILVKKII